MPTVLNRQRLPKWTMSVPILLNNENSDVKVPFGMVTYLPENIPNLWKQVMYSSCRLLRFLLQYIAGFCQRYMKWPGIPVCSNCNMRNCVCQYMSWGCRYVCPVHAHLALKQWWPQPLHFHLRLQVCAIVYSSPLKGWQGGKGNWYWTWSLEMSASDFGYWRDPFKDITIWMEEASCFIFRWIFELRFARVFDRVQKTVLFVHSTR